VVLDLLPRCVRRARHRRVPRVARDPARSRAPAARRPGRRLVRRRVAAAERALESEADAWTTPFRPVSGSTTSSPGSPHPSRWRETPSSRSCQASTGTPTYCGWSRSGSTVGTRRAQTPRSQRGALRCAGSRRATRSPALRRCATGSRPRRPGPGTPTRLDPTQGGAAPVPPGAAAGGEEQEAAHGVLPDASNRPVPGHPPPGPAARDRPGGLAGGRVAARAAVGAGAQQGRSSGRVAVASPDRPARCAGVRRGSRPDGAARSSLTSALDERLRPLVDDLVARLGRGLGRVSEGA
jgi:hypothetical protein